MSFNSFFETLFTRLLKVKHGIKNLLMKYWFIPRAYNWTSKLNILSDEDSINYLLDYQCSLSRYGDGEFNMIRGIGNDFQSYDEELANRLLWILKTPPNDSKFKVGIPLPIKELNNLFCPYAFWPKIVVKHLSLFKEVLSNDYTYINASITRFYLEKSDKSNCERHLKLLKSIWNGKNILIVEGDKTRSGVGNDLYSNALRIKRILCPSINAYAKYDVILSQILKNAQKDELILISLGMTATVLAFDLSRLGFYALDLGHLDIEYEWFLKKIEHTPIAVKGKFVNEAAGGSIVDVCNDAIYHNQIVCVVS